MIYLNYQILMKFLILSKKFKYYFNKIQKSFYFRFIRFVSYYLFVQICLYLNILFYNQNGFFFYDKDREVERDIDVICDNILQNLNSEIEYQRGNDHDRVISAINVIGQKLGYVVETEFSQSGSRIDLVWYNRDGKIEVAGEVETTSTWKKDLISTWEVEPILAIIVGFPKTDKVAENLMKLTLMKIGI